MIDREGHVKLIDFGLSHESFVSLSPITGRVGTVTHMAPELFVREAQYTKEVDWWSVGVLLFEMLVGEDPFESKTCKHLEKKLLEREIIRRITSNDFKIAYPEFMSDSAKLLLQGLFMRDPTKRVTQGVAVAQYKFEEVHSSKPWTGTD
jgi:serine/threonine protein kinase